MVSTLYFIFVGGPHTHAHQRTYIHAHTHVHTHTHKIHTHTYYIGGTQCMVECLVSKSITIIFCYHLDLLLYPLTPTLFSCLDINFACQNNYGCLAAKYIRTKNEFCVYPCHKVFSETTKMPPASNSSTLYKR